MIRAVHSFPRGFLWGTATSSHQVEGDNQNSDWWLWEKEGRVTQGQRSGRACEWWNGRWKSDLDLAAGGDQTAHRLSIEWSRIEPAENRWDDDALTYYRIIVQGILERGMIPMVTLHHFTNPIWLAERGGWENPEVSVLFERYVRRVAEALGDLVGLWVTINEPNAYATLAYVRGEFPPGIRSLSRARIVMHHLTKAHALAYRALHEVDPGCMVGLAHLYRGFKPARRGNLLDAWSARMRFQAFNEAFPRAVTDGKLRLIGQRIRVPEAAGTQDFFGLNYYTSEKVWFDPRNLMELFGRGGYAPDADLSPMGFIAIEPNGLWDALRWARGFGLPIYITENGIEDHRDHVRPRYLAGHLKQVWRAANANWRIRGYFHWTLVDNFEWDRGWTQRFGLYALDVQTMDRHKRPSADFFREICEANALSSEMVGRYAPEAFNALFPGSKGFSGLARAE